MSFKSLLHSPLLAVLVVRLRVLRTRFDNWIVPIAARNGFLASLYYTFFSTRFRREHRAVLLGRLQYQQSIKEIGRSSALLRRNIHRLEKGLIMQPRRQIFAEGYICETVDVYARCIGCNDFGESERKWATDVLSLYFKVVKSTQKIDKAHRLFNETIEVENAPESVPYPHSVLPPCPIAYDELYTLYRRRRSVRWYQNKPIPRDLIAQAVKAARLAPSACNRQPFSFRVVDDPNAASEVAACAMGTAGFSDNLPCVIAVVGDLSAYPMERDRHVIYIDGALVAMQLMLAAETLGLSSCPINWPDIEEREQRLAKCLGLKFYERTIIFLAVGYADPEGGIPFSAKKTSEQLIHWVDNNN